MRIEESVGIICSAGWFDQKFISPFFFKKKLSRFSGLFVFSMHNQVFKAFSG